jgi:hypothetical protein
LLLLAKGERLLAARAGDGCVPAPEQQETKKKLTGVVDPKLILPDPDPNPSF